jgi:adenine phosphoribosyltransferase
MHELLDAARRLIRPGKGRCDLSALLAAPREYSAVVQELARPFVTAAIDRVVGIDVAGVPFAAGVALKLGVGLALIRAGGKAAGDALRDECVDYTGVRKQFDLVSDAIRRDDRTLLVDDWAETGEQLAMARRLVESAGGVVVGAACVNFDDSARENGGLEGVVLHAALVYPNAI